MAFINIHGDDEKRLQALSKNEDRTPTAMVKRLIAVAYRALIKDQKDK